jgi:hypothetical protein
VPEALAKRQGARTLCEFPFFVQEMELESRFS